MTSVTIIELKNIENFIIYHYTDLRTKPFFFYIYKIFELVQ